MCLQNINKTDGERDLTIPLVDEHFFLQPSNVFAGASSSCIVALVAAARAFGGQRKKTFCERKAPSQEANYLVYTFIKLILYVYVYRRELPMLHTWGKIISLHLLVCGARFGIVHIEKGEKCGASLVAKSGLVRV